MKRCWPILLRIAIGGVFVWAGAVKAWDPKTFADAIDGYQLLPSAGSAAVAFYLPWLEIVCGLALITNRLASGGMAILSVLLLVFMAAILSAWWRGLDISCGCFSGAAEGTDYAWPLMRDWVLLAAIGMLAVIEKNKHRYQESSLMDPC